MSNLNQNEGGSAKKPDLLDVDAVGELTVAGVGFYDMHGIFKAKIDTTKYTIYLHSERFGDVVGVAVSEMVGSFRKDITNYVGTCRYSLVEDADGVGVALLLIYNNFKHQDEKTLIGWMTGPAEGLIEADLSDKKGHLRVEPYVQQNSITFESVRSTFGVVLPGAVDIIKFTMTKDPIVASRETYAGFNFSQKDDRNDVFTINVYCSHQGTKAIADIFSDNVNENEDHMIHTKGGQNRPRELYFVLEGILSLDGIEFAVTLGMGNHGGGNWHLACFAVVGEKNNKSGYFYDRNTSGMSVKKFHIVQLGDDNTFVVTKTNLE